MPHASTPLRATVDVTAAGPVDRDTGDPGSATFADPEADTDAAPVPVTFTTTAAIPDAHPQSEPFTDAEPDTDL